MISIVSFQIGKANHQAVSLGKIHHKPIPCSRLADMKTDHLRVSVYKLLKGIFERLSVLLIIWIFNQKKPYG